MSQRNWTLSAALLVGALALVAGCVTPEQEAQTETGEKNPEPVPTGETVTADELDPYPEGETPDQIQVQSALFECGARGDDGICQEYRHVEGTTFAVDEQSPESDVVHYNAYSSSIEVGGQVYECQDDDELTEEDETNQACQLFVLTGE